MLIPPAVSERTWRLYVGGVISKDLFSGAIVGVIKLFKLTTVKLAALIDSI